jgi:hypothetical protein
MKRFTLTPFLFALAASVLHSAALHVGAGHPFATITQALHAAEPGDTVIVHEGVYRETAVVQDDDLTIVAAEGEHVVISGLDPVTAWQGDGAHVFAADITLDPALEFPMVFVEHRRFRPAAYPDIAEDQTRYDHWGLDGITLTATAATDYATTIDFPTGKPDNYWAGGIHLGLTGKSWQINDNEILASTATTLTGDKLIGRETEGHGGVPTNTGLGRGIILFHRNALDAVGEFHYDRQTSRVYLWHAGPEPSPGKVEVRTRHWGLSFNGHANITVRNITFYAAGVDMSETDNGQLIHCEILYGTSFYTDNRNRMDHYSLDLREANGALIHRNYIAHGWGPALGMRALEFNRGLGIIIRENIFENTGWISPTQGAVHLYGAKKDLVFSHNTLRNLASEAISGYAYGMTLSHNYISTVMTNSVDGGAIYLYGQGGDASRSYNWIEHCYDYIEPIRQDGHDNVRGIYTDGGADYHHIHNNVIWRCTDGTNHNNEDRNGDLLDIRVRNNTFWDIDDRMMSGWWGPGGDGIVTDMTTHNNLGNGVSSKFEDDPVPFLGSTTPINQVFNNYSTLEEGTSAADLFVDSTPDEFGDFRLKAGSPAIDYGVVFEGFPNAFDWSGAAPDAGAYEFGDDWTAGAPSFALAGDGFESSDPQGGEGWASGWSFAGDVTYSSEEKEAFHQEFGLQFRGGALGAIAEREVALRHAKVATLSFYWRAFSLEEGESISISVLDGEKEYLLRVIEDTEDSETHGQSWIEWRLETLDLTGYGFENATQVLRIDASLLADADDRFFLDSLRIDDYFTVIPDPLELGGVGASGVSASSAILNGTLVATGGSPTRVTIVWDVADNGNTLEAWPNSIELGYLEPGPFNTSLDALTSGVEYVFRIYAVNDAGDSVWSPMSGRFTPEPPVIPQAGLELWLDGEDIDADGVAEGTGEGGLDGNAVLSWRDKSENGAEAIPVIQGSPKLDLDGLSGVTCVRFEGAARSMEINRAFALHTVFAVVKGDDTGEFEEYYRIFASPLEASGGERGANPLMTSPVAYYNNLKFSTIDADTSVNGRNLATNLNNGGLERLEALGLQPNDAVILRTSSTGGTTPVVSDWRLGDVSSTWNGLIAELIVYSRPLTPLEINRVGYYLARKWGFSSISEIVADELLPPHEVDFTEPALAAYLLAGNSTYASNFASNALLDDDGDKISNQQEFHDGTDMTDPDSVVLFRLSEVGYDAQADAIEISLNGLPAATYRLVALDPDNFAVLSGEAMPLLGAGPGIYNPLEETVTSNESGQALLRIDQGDSPALFLRVEVLSD